jgi:3-oxoadipate enol-lactonase
MTQLHSRDLARPDATIRYWTGGAADGSPVVFLHAATLDHCAWHPQTDALLRHYLG